MALAGHALHTAGAQLGKWRWTWRLRSHHQPVGVTGAMGVGARTLRGGQSPQDHPPAFKDVPAGEAGGLQRCGASGRSIGRWEVQQETWGGGRVHGLSDEALMPLG